MWATIRPKALEPNLFYLPFLGLHLVFSTNVIAYVFMGHAMYGRYLTSILQKLRLVLYNRVMRLFHIVIGLNVIKKHDDGVMWLV